MVVWASLRLSLNSVRAWSYYPLVKKAKPGTLVAPRSVKGCFTMEEFFEAPGVASGNFRDW